MIHILKKEERNTKLKYKKAAMFGLDARVALAIFGALSVISGAALYSTLARLEVVTLVHTMGEVSKAVEAYMLDMGKDLTSKNTQEKITLELLESTEDGWRGPYIENAIKHSVHDHFIHLLRKSLTMPIWICTFVDEGLGDTNAALGDECISGKPCLYWLKSHIQYIGYGEEMVYKLDEYIDNSDGLDKGKFRANWYLGDRTDPIIFYKLHPTITQP
ncbi:MAG: hypothetical protein GY793_05145 [Proteobacteria bacterium]|nr:hypothetical protein [Pseudomonadota bacterium]